MSAAGCNRRDSGRLTLVKSPLTPIFLWLAARWRVALLAVATTLVWVVHYDRWTVASWTVPTDYSGDSLEILARIAAAAEGETGLLQSQTIGRLAAPFGANWSAYPSSDLPLVVLLGKLARVVGVFAAANLALLLATVSAALAFYGCARWLRTRWEWAFAGALLFAFTFQTFSRGLPHLFLVFAWTVPLALMCAGLVASSRRLRLRAWSGMFCLSVGLVIGVGNPYTLFLFLQLLGWGVVAQWLGPRSRENLRVGLGTMAVAVAAFFIVESHVWLFAPDTAAASPLVRNYGSTERYALKPLELFLPPASHRWEALAFFGNRYVRWSEWRTGEAFAPYLGMVGIAAFGWLAWATLQAILRRRRIPGVALPAGWVLVFASVGGLTNIVAFFTGLVVFRATNRFSIFLSAAVLLFLVSRISRWWGQRPAQWQRLSGLAAVLVLCFGLADQMPRAPGLEKQEQIAARVATDRALGELLEGKLPAGAMVFQLPVMMFPEGGPRGQLGDYEHFRPYLATSSLRFSYGTLKGRSRGRWQRDAENLSTEELVQRLERYGFSALYLNKKGFADRGEKLLAELAAMGRTQMIEGRQGDQVAVMLQPHPEPKLPVARTLTFGEGWHSAAPGQPRWAHGPASFSFFNPTERPLPTQLRLVLSGAGERNVRLRHNHVERLSVKVGVEPQELNIQVTMRPGFNRIDLSSLEPATRASQERGHLRTFAVHETTVQVEIGLAVAGR